MPSKSVTKKTTRSTPTGTRRSTVARKKLPAQLPEISRLVVGQDGRIVFASAQIAKLLGVKMANVQGRSLREILDFVSPEDALHDRPGLGFGRNQNDDTDAWTASIISGDHDVIPLAGKKAKSISLRFDRVSLPDGRDFLVASGMTTPAAAAEDVAQCLVPPPPLSAPSAPATKQVSWDRFLQSFVEMGNDFMVLLTARGKIQQANGVFYKVFECDQAMLEGKPFLDFVHPEDRSYTQAVFKNLSQDDYSALNHIINFECRIVSPTGKQHWLDCHLKLQHGHLMLVGRDLTETKRNELALLRHEQQLSEAQSIGRMGHWTWRIGEQELEFSSEIYRIFGVSADDFIPTIDSVNALMHRRDRGRMAQAFQRAMIERKNYEMEFRIIRPDGSARFILLQGRCEMDNEGDVSALFGIMQDITERTQHERELKDAVAEAERAYAAKSQFLANMSHELRTPLNAIIGFSEMIGRQMLGPIGTEKYLEYISGIRESGEHLLDLITDILDMSKIEAGKYTLDVEEFNLSKVLRLAIHMIEGRALDAQVKVYSTIPDDADLHMTGDRRAIMQMVLNLLSNSVKFTEPGGEVRITCDAADNLVTIRVVDTGIGIPASKLRYVTKPFEQAANHFTRNHEGSGLGLAITKELAELHGGGLEIASTVGVGTTVAITLPLVAIQRLQG